LPALEKQRQASARQVIDSEKILQNHTCEKYLASRTYKDSSDETQGWASEWANYEQTFLLKKM
jgi:K+-transporting ATPase c subunit